MIFTSANEFSIFIEMFANEHKMTYTDSILKYCESNFLEPEDIKSLVGKSLKDKLAVEMRQAGMLPRQPTLEDL
jgi:hypothetical protein